MADLFWRQEPQAHMSLTPEKPSEFASQPSSNSEILLRFKEPLAELPRDEFVQDFDPDQEFDFLSSKHTKTKGITFISDSESATNSNQSPFVERARSIHNGVKFDTEPYSKDLGSSSQNTRTTCSKHQSKQNSTSSTDSRHEKSTNRRSLSGLDLNSNPSLKHSTHPPVDLPKRRPANLSTPVTKPRLALVKVSLTPAQKVQRNNQVKLKNALEDYEFSTLVGRGAFANVYKGTNLKTNQVVAIKQIILERDQDVGDLMNEIDLLKILKHPHIVKYHGFVKTSATLNVFLEFCAGGSLRQLYKRLGHGLPENRLSSYVKMILLGLEYLHEQGVVHRDVKAANVLLSEGGVIKLADFGVASKVSSQHQTVVGTPNWMAPETILGGDGLCTVSDIWSLGATIIELFTTNPPYHDLNPMATLHAIGTDDHPPLPKGLTPLARDFLLECFQKQPGLRISALLLLKHKWITGTRERKSQTDLKSKRQISDNDPNQLVDMSQPTTSNVYSQGKAIGDFKETQVEENWNSDFDGPISNLQSKVSIPAISKEVLLHKFSDSKDDMEFGTQNFKGILQRKDTTIDNLDDSDPFLEIDIDDFDTKEIEIQTKMEYLMSKLSSRVENLSMGEELAPSLLKITGRMLHMVKKYESLHLVLIREHGILTLLELLDSFEMIKGEQRLWYHTLSVLNIIFQKSIAQLENFCLLGGIPLVAQFRSSSFESAVRLQVIKFVKLLEKSDKALSMFVSCGGLRVLAKFVQEDLESAPEYSLVSIDCIYKIMTNDLSRSKSDLCRMLSKYGIVFWFVVLLNGLTNGHKTIESKEVSESISKIMKIIKFFGQSEAKVRAAISSSELFKLVMKVYSKLDFSHRLTILKFLKSISSVSGNLRLLQNADILEFLVGLMKQYTPTEPHYREVINIVSPLLYNCCYLNGSQETELVRLGAVPLLKALSVINLPFRQFILPILCELVHCNDYVRQVLRKNDVSKVYLNLVLDPYWQSAALEALSLWGQYNPEHMKLTSPHTVNCFIGGFSVNQVPNFESSLDSYLKLMVSSEQLQDQMVTSDFIDSILAKLSKHSKSPVIQLGILRILKLLALRIYSHGLSNKLVDQLETLNLGKTSVLVSELAREILQLWSQT